MKFPETMQLCTNSDSKFTDVYENLRTKNETKKKFLTSISVAAAASPMAAPPPVKAIILSKLMLLANSDAPIYQKREYVWPKMSGQLC